MVTTQNVELIVAYAEIDVVLCVGTQHELRRGRKLKLRAVRGGMDMACHAVGEVEQVLVVGAADDARGRAIDDGSRCEQEQCSGPDKGLQQSLPKTGLHRGHAI